MLEYNPHKYQEPEQTCQNCGQSILNHFAKCKSCKMVFTQGIIHKCVRHTSKGIVKRMGLNFNELIKRIKVRPHKKP